MSLNNVHFNIIILPSISRSSNFSVPLKFPHQKRTCTSPIPLKRYSLLLMLILTITTTNTTTNNNYYYFCCFDQMKDDGEKLRYVAYMAI